MQDPTDSITQAADGITKQVAEELGISLSRCYELLSKDNPSPKLKRIIRAIAHRDYSPNKDRIQTVKADYDAFFYSLLHENELIFEVQDAEFVSELFDAINARLKKLAKADQLNECRQAVAKLNLVIAELEREVYPVRGIAHEAVNAHRR
jgi:hypothetical protein